MSKVWTAVTSLIFNLGHWSIEEKCREFSFGHLDSMLVLLTLPTKRPLVPPQNFFNSLRPRRSRRHFADGTFKCIFLNENEWISRRISLRFVPKVRNNNIPSLLQIMAWRRPGDKPLSEPMVVSLLTHICVTRPQWVKEWEYCVMVYVSRKDLKMKAFTIILSSSSPNRQIMACLLSPIVFLFLLFVNDMSGLKITWCLYIYIGL